MLCNDCGKNEATIHSINYINGEKSELHVCAECAKNHPELNFGFNSFGFNALEPTDLIKKFFGLGNDSLIGQIANEIHCKTCNSTLSDFNKTGLFGCPDCYDTFAEEIIPVLQKTQPAVSHKGNVPVNKEQAPEDKEKNEKLQSLQEELKKMISEEKYEEAAKIRDEIKAMKGE